MNIVYKKCSMFQQVQKLAASVLDISDAFVRIIFQRRRSNTANSLLIKRSILFCTLPVQPETVPGLKKILVSIHAERQRCTAYSKLPDLMTFFCCKSWQSVNRCMLVAKTNRIVIIQLCDTMHQYKLHTAYFSIFPNSYI